jgi:hypothetical protein
VQNNHKLPIGTFGNYPTVICLNPVWSSLARRSFVLTIPLVLSTGWNPPGDASKTRNWLLGWKPGNCPGKSTPDKGALYLFCDDALALIFSS